MIHDEGTVSLAKVISNAAASCRLLTLNLANNGIGKDGVVSLCGALQRGAL